MVRRELCRRGDGDRPVQPEGTVGVKRQASPAHTALVPEYAPAKAQEELPAQNKKVSKAIRIGIIVATVVIVIAIAGIIWLLIKDNSSGCISISAYSQSKQDAFTTNPALAASAIIEFPWEYGDTAFAQRISNFNDTIEVRGRVPAGSALEAACDSSNAVAAMPFVGEDGSFTFNVRMAYAGDYVIHLKCTTGSGQVAERDMHVQRVPNWSTYTSGAYQMNYASFAYESKQAYRIKGTVTEILKEDDYILAVLEIESGNKLVLEYHNHYGSAAKLEVGKSYERIYGRPMGKGLNDLDLPQIYVWFIDG